MNLVRYLLLYDPVVWIPRCNDIIIINGKIFFFDFQSTVRPYITRLNIISYRQADTVYNILFRGKYLYSIHNIPYNIIISVRM